MFKRLLAEALLALLGAGCSSTGVPVDNAEATYLPLRRYSPPAVQVSTQYFSEAPIALHGAM
ncbi:MAG TPA: hypothetical protein VGH51_16770 [Candidatus Angelobacter sp.]|jgi:hypothetical protein